MNRGNVIIKPKSSFGYLATSVHGKEYNLIKIAEKTHGSNFIILIKSVKDNSKLLVNIEKDKDFVVKFN